MEVMKLYVSSYKKMMLNAEDTDVRYYCYTDIHELPRELSHFNTHRNEADGGEAEEEMALKVLMTKPQPIYVSLELLTGVAPEVMEELEYQRSL